MKIREDFVTNSSSTSFICKGCSAEHCGMNLDYRTCETCGCGYCPDGECGVSEDDFTYFDPETAVKNETNKWYSESSLIKCPMCDPAIRGARKDEAETMMNWYKQTHKNEYDMIVNVYWGYLKGLSDEEYVEFAKKYSKQTFISNG